MNESFAALGMGTALPGPAIGSEQLLADLEARFGLQIGARGRAAARQLGVRTRHICRDLRDRHEAPRPPDRNAALAARATIAALRDAGRELADVRYLIAHTATPGVQLPPGAAEVAGLLGYAGPYVELRQACTGFANALMFARSVLDPGSPGVVVIVGSETGSVYFDPLRAAADDTQLVNLLQMGDGAAAIVLGAPAPHGAQLSRIYHGHIGRGRKPGLQLQLGGSDHLANTRPPAEFLHDFVTVRQAGETLFRAGLDAASALGISLSDVQWLLPHQANGQMATLVGNALGFDPARVFVNADRIGNTGSAAIWLALAELRQRMSRGERALVLGAEATGFMFGGFVYAHA